MMTDEAGRVASPLTKDLGHRLRSTQVWVRHSQYAAAEPAGYVRDTAPFEAADALDLQAREILALRAELASERSQTSAARPIVKLTVGSGGRIAGASFYCPGLPPGVHDLWRVPVTATDDIAAAVAAARDACASAAWTHYLDVCKARGLAPSEHEHWNAARVVREACDRSE